jgi:hypothetical protein
MTATNYNLPEWLNKGGRENNTHRVTGKENGERQIERKACQATDAG